MTNSAPRHVLDTEEGVWGAATATFDPTRLYRYHLTRIWNHDSFRVNFLMLNPSTADAMVVDPTVRRCLGFATLWGAGSLEVTNIFALRSTDPKVLRQVADPVGPDNDEAIVLSALRADVVVAAWGAHGTYMNRETRVREILAGARVVVNVLTLTKVGHPGHPLYVAGNTKPTPWM